MRYDGKWNASLERAGARYDAVRECPVEAIRVLWRLSPEDAREFISYLMEKKDFLLEADFGPNI